MWTHRCLATAATMWEARSAAAILGRGVSRAALIWLLVLMQAAAEDVAAPLPEADVAPIASPASAGSVVAQRWVSG